MSTFISKELRFIGYCMGLYATFMLWAFLQERITSTKYSVGDEEHFWTYPVALNLAMAAGAYITSVIIEVVHGEAVDVPIRVFW